jgi:DNA-binding transcriptional LysR family regulator
MIAAMQSTPSALELASVLAMHRGGTLSAAAALLGADGSTVFRTLQRLERRVHQRLFERSRSGYRATELGQQWAALGERIEVELEAARALTQIKGGAVTGRVRISTTDTLLQGLLLPALPALAAAHPQLECELDASNEPASLTRRDADIALRATRKPPGHLVGRSLGAIRSAVFARRPPRSLHPELPALPAIADCPWIAPDEALPDHLSVRWRKRHLPRVVPRYGLHSVLGVFQAIEAGLGVGIVPLFLAAGRDDLVPLTPPLEECETQLWLLTHPESRHLRRISTVAAHLAEHIRLD